MFLENAFFPGNKFWKYVLGAMIIISASFVGQLPLLFALILKSFETGRSFPATQDQMMTFLEPNTMLFLLLISFVFAFIAIFLVITYIHKQTFLSLTTSRKKVDWKRILFSFSLWGTFSAGSIMVMYYLDPKDFIYNFKPIPFLVLTIIGILLMPFQTSTEEYLFRGYLMQGFAVLAKNRWLPLVSTSLIFGLLHITNPEVAKLGNIILIYYIGTGFFLGIITLMDEGMELALGFHAANNLVGALLVTSDWSAFQTHSIFKDASDPSAGFDVILPVLVVFPIMLFIFSKKYNWYDWKEKLTGKIENKVVDSLQNIENYD